MGFTSRPGAHPGTNLLRFGVGTLDLDVVANMVAFILDDKPTWNNNKSTFFDACYVYVVGGSDLHYLRNYQNCALERDVITDDVVIPVSVNKST